MLFGQVAVGLGVVGDHATEQRHRAAEPHRVARRAAGGWRARWRRARRGGHRGADTRALGEHRVEVDEVAEREAAGDAVGARRSRTGSAAPSPRTSGASTRAAASMPAEKSMPTGVYPPRGEVAAQVAGAAREVEHEPAVGAPSASTVRRRQPLSRPSEMMRFMRS